MIYRLTCTCGHPGSYGDNTPAAQESRRVLAGVVQAVAENA